jgi:nitrate/nitrite transporter NarK
VFWAPTILRSAGIENVFEIGVLLVIPNAIGLVAQLAVARSSDRHQERHWHVAGCILTAALGWLLLPFVSHSVPLTVVALMLSISGTIASFAPFFSLPPTYLSRAAAPAGIALVTTVGSFAGFVMPLVIGRFTAGTGNLAFAQYCVGALLTLGGVVLIWLSRRTPAPKAAVELEEATTPS